MPKPQGFCIFCGRAGLSKQHIWSDMLKSAIPRKADHTQFQMGVTMSGKVVRITPTLRYGQGDYLNTKIRKVCTNCNSGWMSQIEQRLRPLLARLITGERSSISNEQLADLSIWICIATVMAEFTDPANIAIPSSDYRYIFDNRKPPPHWRVRFGHYLGSEYSPSRYRHAPSAIMTLPLPADFSQIKCNSQVSIHVLGEVLFQVISLHTDRYDIDNLYPFQNLGEIALFPNDGTSITWPPPGAIGDAAAERLLLQNYGGPMPHITQPLQQPSELVVVEPAVPVAPPPGSVD